MTAKNLTFIDHLMSPDYFPDMEHPLAQRDDIIQNWRYMHRRSTTEALERFFHALGLDAIVANEVPLAPRLPDGGDLRMPDLMVAFDGDMDLLYEQHGYDIESQGKAPEFVLEVAAPTTGWADYNSKRRAYERYGVLQYWRFDPSGGEYHDAPLAGDRMVNGRYEPIPVETLGDGSIRGFSDALRLYVGWVDGELLFQDPASGSYLSSYREEEAARRAAEARAAELEAEIRRLRGE